MKKLTSIAPQAGVRRSAPPGPAAPRPGAGAARTRPSRARSRGGTTGPGRRRPGSSGPPSRTRGSRRPAPARGTGRRGGRPRAGVRHPAAEVEQRPLRRAGSATRSRTAAAIAMTPSGVSQRPSPGERDEQLAPGQVAHQLAAAGRRRARRPRRDQRSRAEADPVEARSVPGSLASRRLDHRPASADRGGQHEADDEVDQEDHPPVGDGQHHAPKSGPTTLPSSWTAETTPSGTPRRCTG